MTSFAQGQEHMLTIGFSPVSKFSFNRKSFTLRPFSSQCGVAAENKAGLTISGFPSERYLSTIVPPAEYPTEVTGCFIFFSSEDKSFFRHLYTGASGASMAG